MGVVPADAEGEDVKRFVGTVMRARKMRDPFFAAGLGYTLALRRARELDARIQVLLDVIAEQDARLARLEKEAAT